MVAKRSGNWQNSPASGDESVAPGDEIGQGRDGFTRLERGKMTPRTAATAF
jgi:hypothetical protein